MRKNKKISTKNLYIGKIVLCETYPYFDNSIRHGFGTLQKNVKLHDLDYTIVRKEYDNAYDVFNNTEFPIFDGPYINGIAVSLEFPIPAQFGSKIRYKDAENILKAYKNIVFEKRAKEYEDNVSEETTKLYKDNVSDGSTKLCENDISKVKKR